MSLDNPQRLEDLLNYRLSRLLALSSAPGIRLFEEAMVCRVVNGVLWSHC
jgi:hypothetical protein